MTRAEFLEQLRSALQGNVQEHVVQENVAYYNQYISEELQKGKTEEEVLQMLGDPWILAKLLLLHRMARMRKSYMSPDIKVIIRNRNKRIPMSDKMFMFLELIHGGRNYY